MGVTPGLGVWLPPLDPATRRPRFRVGDVVRAVLADATTCPPLAPTPLHALRAMAQCRTAALGGHLDRCGACGAERPSYNSCRNRHCPSCQGSAARAWVSQRLERILPVPHFHVVFTVPAALRPLFALDPAGMYDRLFAAATTTLRILAADRWGVQLGITAVLHTWNQDLGYHPHLHCIVTGGGLDPSGRWKASLDGYLLPQRWLASFFCGAMVRALRTSYADKTLVVPRAWDRPKPFSAAMRRVYSEDWVVYAKRPFGGPEGIFEYLGRYTHKVGISDHRLVDVTDDTITFARRNRAPATVTPAEFVRRLARHILPDGFRKIRHYGLYASSNAHTRLEVARAQIPAPPPPAPTVHELADVVDVVRCVEDENVRQCPVCQAWAVHRLLLPRARPTPQPARFDSS